MKILFIGDVVGKRGCEALQKELTSLKRDSGADVVIVNGENSAEGNGITAHSAGMIFDAGADVITTGNHCFRQKGIEEELERNDRIIRPANYDEDVFGRGVCTLDCGAYSIAVINLLGTTYMQPLENPFKCADRLLEKLDSRIVIVDFHAEATSEKRAMGYYLSGRTSAVLGTHTHVTTADEQIIDGTGYITDVGMTGPKESVLGVDKDIIIERFLTYYPKRHIFAGGDIEINGVCLDIDVKSGKCTKIERVRRLVQV
ncbi:MAG: TIGR00282 family metallophosphoesterase [Ruminococcaceae bacterium]|nr:TIGR00282 family metallophosphoesterase [Oscillospiraceae bacterium]